MGPVSFASFAWRVLACALLLTVSACDPGATGNAVGNAAAAAAGAEGEAVNQAEWDRQWKEEGEKIVLPVDPRHTKLELTPVWLEGYWVEHKPACYGSDSGIRFGADGRWQDHLLEGRYTVEGATVALKAERTHDGDPPPGGADETFTARLAGPNEIDTSWSNGATARLYRCPPGGLKP
jgi:hypothetical protein